MKQGTIKQTVFGIGIMITKVDNRFPNTIRGVVVDNSSNNKYNIGEQIVVMKNKLL